MSERRVLEEISLLDLVAEAAPQELIKVLICIDGFASIGFTDTEFADLWREAQKWVPEVRRLCAIYTDARI